MSWCQPSVLRRRFVGNRHPERRALRSYAFPGCIKIIVPFAPGGPIDAIARPLAAAMREIMGATVVIENRSGAGGIIGSEAVASAAPDGYTLLMTTGSHIGNKLFNSAQVRYDPLARASRR